MPDQIFLTIKQIPSR